MRKFFVVGFILLVITVYFMASAAAAPESGGPGIASVTPAPAYSQGEAELLARVVYGEARGECFLGKVAVANVALNRFESGLYGDSLFAIVRRPNQFAEADTTNAACMKAVRFLLDNDLRILPRNVYYFKTSPADWRDFTPYCRIMGHSFFAHGKVDLDTTRPYVDASGVLVWPNASLWDDAARASYISQQLSVFDGRLLAGTSPDSAPPVDLAELDRLQVIYEQYKNLLGKYTMLM